MQHYVALLPGVADVPPFDVRCLWGAEVAAWLETLEPPQRAAWLALLRHASLSTGKARPPKRWSSELPALIDAVGTAPLQTKVLGWLAELDLKEARTTRWWSIPQVGPVEANQEVLKGLIWALGPDGDALVATALGRFAQRCFQKIPERGAASLVMGNAVLLTLTTMPDRIGFAELSRLRTCVRYPSARNRIEQLLGEVGGGDVELALEQTRRLLQARG